MGQIYFANKFYLRLIFTMVLININEVSNKLASTYLSTPSERWSNSWGSTLYPLNHNMKLAHESFLNNVMKGVTFVSSLAQSEGSLNLYVTIPLLEYCFHFPPHTFFCHGYPLAYFLDSVLDDRVMRSAQFLLATLDCCEHAPLLLPGHYLGL